MVRSKKSLLLIFLFFIAFPAGHAQANPCMDFFVRSLKTIRGDRTAMPNLVFKPVELWLGDIQQIKLLNNMPDTAEEDSTRGRFEWSINNLSPEKLIERLQKIDDEVIDPLSEHSNLRQSRKEIMTAIHESFWEAKQELAHVTLALTPHMSLRFQPTFEVPTLAIKDISPSESELISEIMGESPRMVRSRLKLDLPEHALDRLFYGYTQIAKDAGLPDRRLDAIVQFKANEEIRIKSLAVAEIFTTKILPLTSYRRDLGRLPLRMFLRIYELCENHDISSLQTLLKVVDTLSGTDFKKTKFKQLISETWYDLANHGEFTPVREFALSHQFRFDGGVLLFVQGYVRSQLRIMPASGDLVIVDSTAPNDLNIMIDNDSYLNRQRAGLDRQRALMQRILSI